MKESYSLVTGASSGIGLEICKYLASKKRNLILTARSEKKLKDISTELSESFKIKCDYISCDLSMIESPKEIYDYCKSKKYNVNAVDHTNDNTDNNCKRTVFGNALKSFLLSSNRIVAIAIIHSFITHHR